MDYEILQQTVTQISELISLIIENYYNRLVQKLVNFQLAKKHAGLYLRAFAILRRYPWFHYF